MLKTAQLGRLGARSHASNAVSRYSCSKKLMWLELIQMPGDGCLANYLPKMRRHKTRIRRAVGIKSPSQRQRLACYGQALAPAPPTRTQFGGLSGAPTAGGRCSADGRTDCPLLRAGVPRTTFCGGGEDMRKAAHIHLLSQMCVSLSYG